MKNNKIKEILECLKDTKDIQYSNCNYLELDIADQHLLYDYITNLQKTNKNHSKKLIELRNKITNLQEENKRLYKRQEKILNEYYKLLQGSDK